MLSFFWQKGTSAIASGAVMFVFGLGLTLASFLDAAPGAAFFLFPGLMLGGLIRIVFGLITIRSSDSSGNGRSMPRPARSTINTYVALPEETPDGYCWQCGRTVKGDAVICLRCGATQAKPASKSLNTSASLNATYNPPGAIPVAVTPASYAADQYPPQGLPGFPEPGMPPQGWPPQGGPPQGWPPQGGPPQGGPPQGGPPHGYPGYPPNYPPGSDWDYPQNNRANPIPSAQRGRRGQPPLQQPQQQPPRRPARERKPSRPFKTLRDWTRR